ncbi:MAG: Maf family protein [bacterium JZ-2024 1]
MSGNCKWVLASASPRRAELMKKIVESFEIRKPLPDEALQKGSDIPEVFVVRNAVQKALSVALPEQEEKIVAADTVVVCQEKMLGKPSSVEEIEEMIWLLQGKWHQVMTGVCLARFPDGKIRSAIETTWVKFCALDRAECRKYAETLEGIDKAGGYAAQGLAARYIEGIEGCFYNVVGLPVNRLWLMMKEEGNE